MRRGGRYRVLNLSLRSCVTRQRQVARWERLAERSSLAHSLSKLVAEAEAARLEQVRTDYLNQDLRRDEMRDNRVYGLTEEEAEARYGLQGGVLHIPGVNNGEGLRLTLRRTASGTEKQTLRSHFY